MPHTDRQSHRQTDRQTGQKLDAPEFHSGDIKKLIQYIITNCNDQLNKCVSKNIWTKHGQNTYVADYWLDASISSYRRTAQFCTLPIKTDISSGDEFLVHSGNVHRGFNVLLRTSCYEIVIMIRYFMY